MMGKLIDNINLPRSPTQGALDGMKQLFEPEWEKMGNYDVSILQFTHPNVFLLVVRSGALLHPRYSSPYQLVTVVSWLSPVITDSTITAPGTLSLSASATPSPPCSPAWSCSRF